MVKVKWNMFIMLINYGGLRITDHKTHMKVFLAKLLIRRLSFRGSLANSYCTIGQNKSKLQVEIGPQCTQISTRFLDLQNSNFFFFLGKPIKKT
jgi:hypothetical protein